MVLAAASLDDDDDARQLTKSFDALQTRFSALRAAAGFFGVASGGVWRQFSHKMPKKIEPKTSATIAALSPQKRKQTSVVVAKTPYGALTVAAFLIAVPMSQMTMFFSSTWPFLLSVSR